jgi:hypothetical protein
MKNSAIAILTFFMFSVAFAQNDTMLPPQDTAAAEEDFSMYENLELADQTQDAWASTKIFDLSPQKLISVGYDWQAPYNINSALVNPTPPMNEQNQFTSKGSHGLRLGFNIPVISKNRLTWTVAGNYWQNSYIKLSQMQTGLSNLYENALRNSLYRGLRTTGLASTLFVPLNATRFVLAQVQADVNGDYALNDFTEHLGSTKVSGALIYGVRPHDRLQWGLGVSRTYRVGELNYIPVFFYNYTFKNRKGGIEMLFPARAAIRRTFNSRNILLFGYELEGQSYSLKQRDIPVNFVENNQNNVELRRGEARIRFTYEKSISGFIWLSFQAGYRINTSFNADSEKVFRGFTGSQPYFLQNSIGNAPYAQISINLVSP